jgi:hypothetical protein
LSVLLAWSIDWVVVNVKEVVENKHQVFTLYFRDWRWEFEIGVTLIGVLGKPVNGNHPGLDFAYEPHADRRYPVRIQAELKRQIVRRFPAWPPPTAPAIAQGFDNLSLCLLDYVESKCLSTELDAE